MLCKYCRLVTTGLDAAWFAVFLLFVQDTVAYALLLVHRLSAWIFDLV